MIIGLSGKKHSGKNTVAGFIKEWCDEREVTYLEDSFAANLKLSAARALGFEGSLEESIGFCDWLKENGRIEIWNEGDRYKHGDWPDGPTRSFTGRQYLQWYGTEAHREVFGDDFWVNQVIDKYLGRIGPYVLAVTDARFPNEAESIRDHRVGGRIINVVRPDLEDDGDSHASEKPLPEHLVDYTIVNDSSLRGLRYKTYEAMEHLLGVIAHVR